MSAHALPACLRLKCPSPFAMPCHAMPRGTREREGGAHEGHTRERGRERERGGRQQTAALWKALEQRELAPLLVPLSPSRSPCAPGAQSPRARRAQSASRAPHRSRASSPSAIGACLRRERGRTCERQHERGSTREQEAVRERGSARGFLHEVLVQRPPFPFLSLSSSVRAEPKRESGDESESARERGGTSRRQRERGGTREREGQQEGGSAACAWGSCRGASFCSGAC